MTTEKIWKDFADELLGFIKARINDADLAEDLLQEIFIKIHLNYQSLKENTSLVGWIYRITRNTIIDYYRKKKYLIYTENFREEFPEELMENVQGNFTNCIKSFLNQLPDKDKDILEKTIYGNVSQKAYAEMHGLSYSAVKSRTQRARKKLKTAFIACCEVESDKYGNIISTKNRKCNC